MGETMQRDKAAPKTIDEYIASFPPDIQEKLQKIRQTVREAAPGAAETIKYQMPTFTLKGNLVHFAAFKAHIAREVEAKALPLVLSGEVKVLIDSTFPLAEAAAAHARIESSAHIGKIVLVVD